MQLETGVCGERRFGRRGGSALILVIVLTVLLSIIGIVFVMVARIDEMATLAVAGNRNLEDGVQTVVSRIEAVLVDDLFGFNRMAGLVDGTMNNEAYDFPGGGADPWLASLEPFGTDFLGTPLDATDDMYQWRHITNLYGNNFDVPPGPPITPEGPYYDPDNDGDTTQWDGSTSLFLVSARNVLAKIIAPGDPVKRVVLQSTPLPPWTDQDTLPPYDKLDDILRCLIEDEMPFGEIAARGHAEETVRRIARMVYIAEYKRRQAPPGVKITSRSFGRDRRYPMTNAFTETLK